MHALLLFAPALGLTPLPATPPLQLERVEVVGRHYDNAVGSSDAASQGSVRAELLKSRPAQRPGELLEFVPGVVVTQHSSDGKANQYFLRGFNLDHGTDFATTVAGLPVNMPSHAHGQGYADLNWLIPELVDRIDYRKGPYFARNGNFSAAGSADIEYRRQIDAPEAALTLGQRGYQRLFGATSMAAGAGRLLLGAVELQRNDGPWTVPERMRKHNAVFRLSGGDAAAGSWSASLMAYDAEWTATDQIPQRLLDAGALGRFDSLDPSDGGSSQRFSLSADWRQQRADGESRLAAYLIDYRLQLFSNFSYALERPQDGDQFQQQDRRRVAGLSASHALDHTVAGWPVRSEFGLQLRHDRARVGLFDSVARRVTATTRDDQLRETQLGLHAQSSIELTSWWRAIAGLRADAAAFRVNSRSQAQNSGRERDQLVSPKLSLIFGPWQRTEFFLNAGRGFHSNDARGTTARVDPKSGEAVAPVPGLVAARGWELGLRSEALAGLQSSLALWQLDFDSELVYVGDAGNTEAGRPSRRYGLEWNNRWLPQPWLLIDADFAWSRARFADADPAGDRIPNTVDKVASLAVTARELGPWSASLEWRYRGSGPLIENNSVRAASSLTTNLRVARRLPALGRRTELRLDAFNLSDRKVKDIEYFYESRLPGEAEAVADRHLHPGEPRTVRLSLVVGLD